PLKQLFYNLGHRAARARTQIYDFYRLTSTKNGRDFLCPSPCERWPEAVRCGEICRLCIAENSGKPLLIAEFKQVQPPHIASLYQQKGQNVCDTVDVEGNLPLRADVAG